MRLLNTTTHRFQNFSSHKQIPKYIILSHRWGPSEVSYQDFLRCQHETDAGYTKIYAFCRYAKASGYDWCWIDTCCIDKTSSTELSEAINAMFKWYQDASLCVVYLEDVSDEPHKHIHHSAWFTRGWTLQELLAPLKIHFLNSRWQRFDTLTKRTRLPSDSVTSPILSLLAEATGIPEDTLAEDWRWRKGDTSIAQIMSWASRRKTLRKEDEAYCLLGLFGISMPLLYGEGEQAFKRLQKKLVKTRAADDTIFYWMPHYNPMDTGTWFMTQGMLATDPACFADSGSIVTSQAAAVHTWTNRGLRYYARCFRLSSKKGHALGPRAWNCEFFVLQTRKPDEHSSRAAPCEIILCKEVGTTTYQRITHLLFRYLSQIELEECHRQEIEDKSFTMEPHSNMLAQWFWRSKL